MNRLYDKPGASLYQIDVKNRLANYIYLLRCAQTGTTAVIDPTDAELVEDALATLGWSLDYVLCTHHHHDHTAGNAPLKAACGCEVVGCRADAERINALDRGVQDGDVITIGALQAVVMFIPGHTVAHIGYYCEAQGLLFSGDTVFSMGCGRLFEGTAKDMTASFARIAALPDDTEICAAHEYSRKNSEFALTVEPENHSLHERASEVETLRAQDMPTVPVSLGKEKATNPFFRLHSPAIRHHLGLECAPDYDVFAALRHKRDMC